MYSPYYPIPPRPRHQYSPVNWEAWNAYWEECLEKKHESVCLPLQVEFAEKCEAKGFSVSELYNLPIKTLFKKLEEIQ